MVVVIMLILLHFLLPSQERYRWLKPVGIRVNAADFDVYYGICLSVP